MNIRRAAIAAMAAGAASALVAAVPASAEELLPIGVTPGSGPAGTEFTVSGADCLGEMGPGDVEVYLFFGDAEPDVFGGITPDAEGDWAVTLLVEDTDPVGVVDISATCFHSPESDEILADYDFTEFEVTEPPAAPPTTDAPAPGPPTASPASPVVAQPTFTG